MLNYKNFIVNSNAYQILKKDITSERISHAYLFTSQDENYNQIFSKIFAENLINIKESEIAQKNILRIENNSHPDVKIYGLAEENIDVSKVSEIVDQAQVSPFESDKKIFILLNIQNMNEASQNKILKTIEEPPSKTYFILSATSTVKILPTIMSRVKTIELDEISTETIFKMLCEAGANESNAKIYANCSNNNALLAEKLSMDSNFINFFNKTIMCFYDINGSRDVLEYSSYFSSKNIDKDEFFNLAELIIRDLSFVILKNYNEVILNSVIEKLKLIASRLNLDATSELMDCVIKSKKDLSYNANSTAVIDNFLFKLVEVKVKCRRLLG